MRLFLTHALLCAPLAAHAQITDRVVDVSAADAEMNAAKAKGRATLPEFLSRFASPAADESDFAIKYDLIPEPGRVEFIWAKVISRSPGTIVAQLINEPQDGRWKIDQQVTVNDAEVIDWGYMKNGVMQGNFTTRVLLGHVTPAEAEAIRRAYGW
jgi:uncharacterized protein YegJ (DUF2314 family)